MSSLPQDNYTQTTPSLEEYETEKAALEKEISDFLKFGKQEDDKKEDKKKEEEEEDEEEPTKVSNKRKRKSEENISTDILTEVFLRIFYPISSCLGKSISIGLKKSLDYSPTVILNHGPRVILFSTNAWESLLKHLHLIECYLINGMCGRKTNTRLLDCDIVVDVIKHRAQVQVRFRDSTQHDNKVLLTREEFHILKCASSPVTRYMKQLVFCSSIIKDYLVDTLEKQPSSIVLYGPVDTSIFNRIPHEVEMWRKLRNFENGVEVGTTTEEEEEEEVGGETKKGKVEAENTEPEKRSTPPEL